MSAKGVVFYSGGALMSPKPFLPARSVGGELRAYGREVRAWSTGRLTRYAAAVALLMAAFAGLIGAIAVGLSALFHFVEMKYGTWIAYGSIGGLLVVLAMFAALLGIAKLRQEAPSPPDPRRHAEAASRIAAADSIAALAASGQAIAAWPLLPAAIGLASMGLLGWLIASRRNAGRTQQLDGVIRTND
jgi:hypothetical protein